MQTFTIERTPHYCPCGAVRAPTDARCQKCIARLRWLRRKAWRTNRVHRQKTHRALAETGDRR